MTHANALCCNIDRAELTRPYLIDRPATSREEESVKRGGGGRGRTGGEERKRRGRGEKEKRVRDGDGNERKERIVGSLLTANQHDGSAV